MPLGTGFRGKRAGCEGACLFPASRSERSAKVGMYAVVETGGKQYCVREGDTFRVEKLGRKPGEIIEFDRVLLVADDEGVVKIGTPVVPGAKVIAKVVSEGKSRKLLVFKYKAKKNYRRRYGHRQPFTEVCIQSILPEAPAAGPDASPSPSDGEEV